MNNIMQQLETITPGITSAAKSVFIRVLDLVGE